MPRTHYKALFLAAVIGVATATLGCAAAATKEEAPKSTWPDITKALETFMAKDAVKRSGYALDQVMAALGRVDKPTVVKIYTEHVSKKGLNLTILGQILRDVNKAVVQNIDEKNRKQHADNPDMLVLPALLANRKTKQIVIHGEATGLTGKGDPPEFFIISENSGHDYESLATAYVRPSDVYKAMLFIGMPTGRRVNFEKLQFWPKGERVKMFFTCHAGDKTIGPVRMESLFANRKSGDPLEESGLVFTGSVFVDSRTKPGEKVYAADAFDPNSIAANYNEPTSVFDVPRQAPQKEVYNNLSVNTKYAFPPSSLLEISIVPEYTDGKKRVVDLTLSASIQPGKTGTDLGELAFTLKDAQGKMINKKPDLNSVLALFTSLAQDGHDPFVTVKLTDELTLKSIHQLSAILASIDSEKGIRVEPPFEGQLYYRAFVPDKSYKDRESRFAQPWELRLSTKDGKVSGILTQIKQVWKKGQVKPDLVVTDIAVDSADALKKELAARGPGLRVIITFAQPTLTHKALMDFITPVRKTHPLIHVFVE